MACPRMVWKESERLPYIDHGFDDFKIDVGKWEPHREKILRFFSGTAYAERHYFHSLRPRGVLFAGGSTGMMPVNHILEYQVGKHA